MYVWGRVLGVGGRYIREVYQRKRRGFIANPQGGSFLYIPVSRFSHTSPSDDYEFTTLQHSIRSSLTNNTMANS